MDMAFMHDASVRAHFDALQNVTIILEQSSRGKGSASPTSTAHIAKEETTRRIRSILQPWDSRGILAVTVKDYINADTAVAEEPTTETFVHTGPQGKNDTAVARGGPTLPMSGQSSSTWSAPSTAGGTQ
ncbi:hypothetical protein FOMPIDRAFT_1021698 [Fomitopsis schrenkii]|uniref:Uncharacterized protein n=1 Tax=Fomitopsis schrenkii TaxID=2126942 RepID=S8EPJ3_FOMSC|nr:hypothetical protein FOMPIDRAFT_1021698 [Fomitopsis schrenkii]